MKYRTKSELVDAVQVTAEWFSGEPGAIPFPDAWLWDNGKTVGFRVSLTRPADGSYSADVGEWIVTQGGRRDVYTDELFRMKFVDVESVSPLEKDYNEAEATCEAARKIACSEMTYAARADRDRALVYFANVAKLYVEELRRK